jgi:exonuclease SbcD
MCNNIGYPIATMRIFHTADWHLGQTFHDYDWDYEHRCFLEWLLGQIDARKPDAMLLAGDVFDSVNPPASAQRMYYDFLKKAVDAHPSLQIVVTAGNHDAAARLEAPAYLLSHFNVHVLGTVRHPTHSTIDYSKLLVPLKNSSGEVAAIVLAVPYLRFTDLPHVPETAEAAAAYQTGMEAFYEQLTAEARRLRDERYPNAVLVGMGHCHLMGGAESRDSERRLIVGGLEALTASSFPAELSYVALGHLHKPQAFQDGRVAYSGSPIPLSFTERQYRHQIWELEFAGTGLIERRSVEMPRAVALLSLPEGGAVPMTELLTVLSNADYGSGLGVEQYPFLEVRYLDDGPDPTRRHRIEEALKYKPVRLAATKFEPRLQQMGANDGNAVAGLGDLRSIDPLEVLLAAHRDSHGGAEPEAEVLAAFREILTQVSL